MVKSFDFKEKFGNTPITPNLIKELIPKNIQNREELNEYELQNIAKGQVWLQKSKHDYLKYNFWLELHEKMYCDVWKFAGSIRKVELSNPAFKMPYDIWPEIGRLEKDLEYWLNNKSFSDKEMLAKFHERILTIHPFLDGNGRWSRLLTEYIAKSTSFPIPTWGQALNQDTNKRRRLYIEALDLARNSNIYDDLTSFMFS